MRAGEGEGEEGQWQLGEGRAADPVGPASPGVAGRKLGKVSELVYLGIGPAPVEYGTAWDRGSTWDCGTASGCGNDRASASGQA